MQRPAMKRSAALVVVDTESDASEQRPRTRGDCKHGRRPCPWIGCRFHLRSAEMLFDSKLGIAGHVLTPSATELEIDAAVDALIEELQRVESCALDVTDRESDGATLDQVGRVMAVTRERIRQIESKALRRLPRSVRRRLGVERGEVRGVRRGQPPTRRR